MINKMNKILLLLLFILFPFYVMANEVDNKVSISVDCNPSSIKPGDTFKCTISGNSNVVVGSFSAKISLGEGMSIVSFLPLGKFDGKNVSDMKIDVYGGEDKGSFDIGLLEIKLDNDIKNDKLDIGLVDMSAFDIKKGDSIPLESTLISKTISITHVNAKKGLKELSMEGLLGIFENNKYGYIAHIKNDIFSIRAIPVNDSDKVSMYSEDSNKTELNPDSIKFSPSGNQNIMAIKIVVGEGGEGNEYNINVQKEVKKEYDNSLATLSVGGKKINLTKGKLDYDVVLDDVTSYNVTATLSDPENFEFDLSNGNGANGNWQGATNVPIIIVPKDASSGLIGVTYSINVMKKNNETPIPDETPSGGNPQTGNISIFIITLILISSLIISLNLYKKNMNTYN